MISINEGAVESLVAATKSGDAMAFGQIFDLYHRSIYRYIAARTRNLSDTEDLTQLVFLKALEALPRYESRGIPFGGWLFRLARNAVIDHGRTRRDQADLDTIMERAGHEPDPGVQVVAAEEIGALERALTILTDQQREVLELRFFGGLSPREVAQAMGKQGGTVRGLQFRALAALRRNPELGSAKAMDRVQ